MNNVPTGIQKLLQASLSGYDLYTELINVFTGTNTENISLIESNGKLIGYIFDWSTFNALSGVRVAVDTFADTTNHNGYYEISNIPKGYPRNFSALMSGYDEYTDIINILPGDNINNDVYLEETLGKVFGYVYELGTNNPVATVPVSIENTTDVSNTNGYYELNNIDIGEQLIWAIEYGYITYNDTITVNEGDNPYDIYLVSE